MVSIIISRFDIHGRQIEMNDDKGFQTIHWNNLGSSSLWNYEKKSFWRSKRTEKKTSKEQKKTSKEPVIAGIRGILETSKPALMHQMHKLETREAIKPYPTTTRKTTCQAMEAKNRGTMDHSVRLNIKDLWSTNNVSDKERIWDPLERRNFHWQK